MTWFFSRCSRILELRRGIQDASCVGPGKSNLPFELRVEMVVADMTVDLRFAVKLFQTVVQYVISDKLLLGLSDLFAFADVPPCEHKIRPDDFLCRFGCRGLNSF